MIFKPLLKKLFCIKKSWFYGCKLLGVCSVTDVFNSLDIMKADVRDINLNKFNNKYLNI